MKKILLKDIITQFPDCHFHGNQNHTIDQVVGITNSLDKDFTNAATWLSDKYAAIITVEQLQFGLIILSPHSFKKFKSSLCNFLVAENPRASFSKLLSTYFKMTWPEKIESTAIIHPSAKIGSQCYIGHHVVIDENCVVGNNTVVLHHTVILANTIIGNNVIIGCNNTIGNYGFGYEKDHQGNYELMQHLGKVIIHDNVEIHNNTCIDRGVLSDTEICEHVKVDNLVHIAHGVTIGRNSLVIANAMIGGSASIGENVWVAPSVSIKNQLHIDDGVFIGLGAVVLKSFEKGTTLVGNPATTLNEQKKWSEFKNKLMTDGK